MSSRNLVVSHVAAAAASAVVGGLIVYLLTSRRKISEKTSECKAGGKWFHEESALWPGQTLSLEYKSMLLDKQSNFQHVQVLDTVAYGKVLVLDGAIQVTDKDEFAYQEMMAHPAMLECAHLPARVLIIGGGDGGVAREILKHPSVNEVIVCEIDPEVIIASKKYFPAMSISYDSPKVKVIHEDGAKYLKKIIDAKDENQFFDVIVTDSSDPIGPAASLFSCSFLELISKALKPGGVASSQGESMWLHGDIISNYIRDAKKVFKDVSYRIISIPTYPGGSIGSIVLKNHTYTTAELESSLNDKFKTIENASLKYYNPQVHIASMICPTFANQYTQES